jgi:hypothetical protein
MHHHRCRSTFAAALLLLATSLAASPALAQQAPAPQSTPAGPFGMSMPEWQGVSCMWGGSLAGLGVFYYSDVLAVAATGVTNPLLLIPLVATGFLGGCSFGANAAPGLFWLFH